MTNETEGTIPDSSRSEDVSAHQDAALPDGADDAQDVGAGEPTSTESDPSAQPAAETTPDTAAQSAVDVTSIDDAPAEVAEFVAEAPAGDGAPGTVASRESAADTDVDTDAGADAGADADAVSDAESDTESDAESDAESDGVGTAAQAADRPSRRATRKAALEAEGDVAADFLEALLDICDIDGDIDVDIDGDRAAVSIVDSDEGRVPRRLVGPDGKVLEALQELTRLAVQTETGERSRLMLDVAGHRAGRRAEIVEVARGVIAEVKESGDQVEMTPMTAFERKIVHDEVLAAGLRSESDGVEPRRFVVVLPAD